MRQKGIEARYATAGGYYLVLVMTSRPGTGAAGAKVLLVGGQVGPHHGQHLTYG